MNLTYEIEDVKRFVRLEDEVLIEMERKMNEIDVTGCESSSTASTSTYEECQVTAEVSEEINTGLVNGVYSMDMKNQEDSSARDNHNSSPRLNELQPPRVLGAITWEEEVVEDSTRARQLRKSYPCDINKLRKDYLYHHNRRRRRPLFKMFEWVERHMVLASLRST